MTKRTFVAAVFAGAAAAALLFAGQASAAPSSSAAGTQNASAPQTVHLPDMSALKSGEVVAIHGWKAEGTSADLPDAQPLGAPKKWNAVSGHTDGVPGDFTWDGVTRHVTTAGVVKFNMTNSVSGGFCGAFLNSSGNGYGTCWTSYGTKTLWSNAPTGVYYFYAEQRGSGTNTYWAGSLYY